MSNELRDKIRAAWPEYAKTHGRQDPDFYIPPVREGGNTAALIDLAVQLAQEQIERERTDAYSAALDDVQRHCQSLQKAAWDSQT